MCCGGRKCIWLFWVLMAAVSGVYCAVSLLNFSNVYKAYDKNDTSNIQGVTKNESILAVLAACFFGSVMVFLYSFVSFFILLGKTTFKSGAGFSYGFITASSIHMALMCLLCGLVLGGFSDEVKKRFERDEEGVGYDWGKTDTAIFTICFIMAYVCTAAYLLFFLVLVFDKGAVKKMQDSKKQSLQGDSAKV